ncbi:hypothetical protein ACFLVX_03630 [Chloroflexota bacterium]
MILNFYGVVIPRLIPSPIGVGGLRRGCRVGSCDYLDPVPKGAKELTFAITKLGDSEGPWEFKIPLE